MPPTAFDERRPARTAIPSGVAVVPLPTHHEQLEELHGRIAHLAQESVATPREEIERASIDPEHARLARGLDEIDDALRRARRTVDALLDAMPVAERRAQLQAVALLARQHDEAARDVHEAQLALREGSAVAVRIRIARIFRAIGRAEQMHFYLRTPRAAEDRQAATRR
jgi:hypothetical protein